MEEYIVKVKSVDKVTYDVLKIVLKKTSSFHFYFRQATEISINKNEWKDKTKPFTFT